MYADSMSVSAAPGVSPDAGARVVSDRIRLSEHAVDGFPLVVCFVGDSNEALVGTGAGAVWSVRGTASAKKVSMLGAMPLCAAPGAGGATLFGTDDGRVLRLTGSAAETVYEQNDGWIEHLVGSARGVCAFATGSSARIVDAGGRIVACFEDHPSTIAGLSFSPDARRLAVAHYGGVSIWQVDTLDVPRRLEWHGSHIAVAWSPDGRLVASAMQDKELHCWRLADGKDMRMAGFLSKSRSIAWTHDGAFFAASGAEVATAWDCRGDGPSGRMPDECGYAYGAVVTQISAHPSERTLAVGYSNGTVLICDIDGDAITGRPGQGAAVSALAWSPDGAWLVAGLEDGRVASLQIAPRGA